jgi:hypothetical protein
LQQQMIRERPKDKDVILRRVTKLEETERTNERTKEERQADVQMQNVERGLYDKYAMQKSLLFSYLISGESSLHAARI